MDSQYERILRKKVLPEIDGLSDSQRDREIRAGRYPPPVKLSTNPKCRAVGWHESAIQKWVKSRGTGEA